MRLKWGLSRFPLYLCVPLTILSSLRLETMLECHLRFETQRLGTPLISCPLPAVSPVQVGESTGPSGTHLKRPLGSDPIGGCTLENDRTAEYVVRRT